MTAARVLATGPYTRDEAAALLRVSVATLDRERLAGKIACLHVRGRVLYTWDAIEAYKTNAMEDRPDETQGAARLYTAGVHGAAQCERGGL